MSFFESIDSNILFLLPFAIGLFAIGIFGVILNNKNLLILMLNIELMFLGICFFLLILSTNSFYFLAQIYTLLILSIAAAESAIGLSLLIIAYKNHRSINFTVFNELHG